MYQQCSNRASDDASGAVDRGRAAADNRRIDEPVNMPSAKPSIDAQISWVYTEDLESSHRFYSHILGFECIRDEAMARIYRTTPGACIGVCRAHGDRVVEPRGGMISIVTNDVDACYRRLLERGLAIAEPPQRHPGFAIYTFFIEDPNGYVIEFQQFLEP
jgi:predicted enzyme related to lactoylglutathione lyase